MSCVARQMRFTPGTILVFDRGYTDYQWFVSLIKQGVYFVTRLKENADYGVAEDFAVPHRRGVRRDQVIFFYQLARASIDAYFRRIEFYDEEHDRVLVFLTSHMGLAAATIASVYKERWQIELFFPRLKAIAILLVKYLQLKAAFGWCLSNREPASRSAVQRQPKRVPIRCWPRGLIPKWSRSQSGALTPPKRGPRSKCHPMDEENQKLRRQNARLAEDLRKAHIIIDVQKNVAVLLGHPIPEEGPGGEDSIAAALSLQHVMPPAPGTKVRFPPAILLARLVRALRVQPPM